MILNKKRLSCYNLEDVKNRVKSENNKKKKAREYIGRTHRRKVKLVILLFF